MTRLLPALVLLLGGCASTRPAEPHARLPLTFDLGPGAPPDGLAWTAPPAGAFVRTGRLAQPRDAVTLGGVVAAERLALRADVPPGRWRLRVWLDGYREDTHADRLTVGGRAVDLGWTALRPPAEPPEGLGRLVREHASTVDVGPGGLELAWEVPGDSVRLLGFELLPVAPPPPDADARLAPLRALDTPETWTDDLEPAVRALESRLAAAAPGTDAHAFAALWLDRTRALRRAEHDLWTLRGYEANVDATGRSLIDRNAQTIFTLDALLTDLRPGEPLYDRALWNRMRAVYWLEVEVSGRGPLLQDEADRAALRARYDTPLLRMYDGEPVATPDACDALAPEPAAPAWATAQREALCRVSALAGWWITHRQAPNGELGGRLGDDVEALRQWVPAALAGDAAMQQAWRRLADVVWASPQLVDGYVAAPIDVEHAAEPVADAQPQLLLWPDHEAAGRARVEPSARHMARTWTVRVAPDAAGLPRRHFRSAWFGTEAVDERPPRNRDLAMNARAARAVRFHAWATGDAAATDVLHEWARAWRDAAERTDKGKPPGVYPVSMRASDLALNGDEPTWHRANMFWPYFEWGSSASADFYDTSVFVHALTGDSTLLAPLHASLALVAAHADALPEPDAVPEGSAAWAAAVLARENVFWEAAGAWRLATGDRRHDALLARFGSPYTRARLAGDPDLMLPGLDDIRERLRVNAPLLREEALYTDRLYVSAARGLGPTDLAAMITGGVSTESPTLAVSWVGAAPQVARYVADATPRTLAVDLYAFGGPAEVTTRLWALAPGRYAVRVRQGGTVTHAARVDVAARGAAVTIPLPPGASRLDLSPE